MKKIAILFLFTFPLGNLYANNNEEFRATWVITWEYINPSYSSSQNKALAREILDNHQRGNFNAVLWQCRQSGTAYYNSSYEPWGYYAGYRDPGYDPLAYAIQEGHKRGIEVHAWFNVFHTSSTYSGTPAAEHSEWICRDRDGNPMTSSRCVSPGLNEVRDYTIKVAMEIVRNYDIDGLHLDFVRWNEYDSSTESQLLAKIAEQQQPMDGIISDQQLQSLIENAGSRYLYDVEHPYNAGIPDSANGGQFPSWEDWWRWTVTEFVRVLHDSIQAVKPWVRLSPAALGKYNWSDWQAYGTVYQDAALWFNEGYIEQLTPTHYHWTTANDFSSMLKSGGEQSWYRYIQPGIEDGRLYTVGPGSYAFADADVWDNHPAVIEKVRTLSWTDGFQFFSYQSWEDYKYWDEASATFFNRKTKIRPIKHVFTPDAPTITLNKLDSLQYEIMVTPAASTDADFWFIIYRSEDDILNVDEDEIVNIHFGQDEYSYIDVFTGLQDYNGQYQYFATMLNRYWNESVISNADISDPIPSFAPTVISSVPAEGDSISIDGIFEVNFSKTMDTTSFASSISCSPLKEIAQLTWINNNKTAVIEPAGYLQFATDYTLTIASSAKDINGKSIDGNGDGIAGDPFFLHFKTKEEDDVPPHILFTYPDFATKTENFDVKDILTILFDELIDPASLDANSVSIYKGSAKIAAQFLEYTVADKTVLNIQPEEPFDPESDYTALLLDTISDTSGNRMENYLTINYKTSKEHYSEIQMIEDFSSPGAWWQPDGSGSTMGIVVYKTIWGYTSQYYLPAESVQRSAYLQYEWDMADSLFLIREYLPSSDPKNRTFDTTYTMQCYVFGDSSNINFRFCIDEGDGSSWTDHEVSQWVAIDWYGWRLVEWKLSDPNSVGEWISSNNTLDGTQYRVDSFQFTRQENSAVSGTIYIDDFRLVKKSTEYIGIEDGNHQIARDFLLLQNYPNPFNARTLIKYYLPIDKTVTIKVYNAMGQIVKMLLYNEFQQSGYHTVVWDGSNQLGLYVSSGLYIFSLETDNVKLSKTMTLLK